MSVSAPHELEKRVLLEGVGERDVTSLEGYRTRRGYQTLERVLGVGDHDGMSPDDVTQEVLKSNLRGRGGAGFPTGRKWTFVPKDTGKSIYLACNADESEPGTFKDRQIMEHVPHLLVEGCLLSSYAIGAKTAYIYVRGEYPQSIAALEKAIDEARAANLVGKGILGTDFDCEIWVHGGAGAYICGEETGMLSSLEGGRGYPRIKPPFPAVEGLWSSPTIINNVESLASVVPIIQDGADAWLALGTEKSPGTRIYGVSGHVEKPGWFEFESKVTLRQVIDAAGGVWKGRQLKAVIPGGSSVPVLKADEIDVECCFDALKEVGSMMGSAGLIVMDETTCMVDALLNLMEFYHHESCGQCTPCREGTGWLEKLVRRIWSGEGKPGDVDLLDSVADTVGGAAAGKTICFLADSAVMPTKSFVKKFRADFEKCVAEGGSPVFKAKQGGA
ncbi:MAG: NADH-quinone oxidoreductase subunit NuoF [Planctomycetota bacterium]|jgi:NADH-quinone oxidoreductase subunit F